MKKLRIVVLFSGGASAVRFLIENDPNYGKHYEFVLGVSNKKDTSGEGFLREKRIPFLMCNTKEFCVARKHTDKISKMPPELRQAYFRWVLREVRCYEPDLIILSGFMLAITFPLLEYCPIINVHPADLSIGENGKRKYVGDDAVTMALAAGEKTTASTIHFVTEEVDGGPIICISDHIPVEPGISAKDHQEKMKILCDGPAYMNAIQMFINKKILQ